MKQYNFYAGPSILNDEVIKSALAAIDKKDGLSLLELSHRGPEIQNLFQETKDLVKELMQLEDRYEVLFLHGGARLQNCMIPYNICTKESANYIDTGIWAKNSIEESGIIRETKILSSSAKDNYSYIPKDFEWDGNGYLHITSNNTVHGSQFHDFSFCKKGKVVADMSSDLLSRDINFNDFGMIYAGLQKNLGTAGGTLVILDKSLLEDLPQVPSMLNYKQHVKADSMLNTPPVFAVIMCNIALKWIAKQGGLAALEAINKTKSDILYNEIDNNPLLSGFVKTEDRSLMNATFAINDLSFKNNFDTYLEEKGIVGIDGHRSKGGYRVSMYNMLPLSHVEYFVDCIQNFKG